MVLSQSLSLFPPLSHTPSLSLPLYLSLPLSLLLSHSLSISLPLSLPLSLQLAGVYAKCKDHLGDLKEHYDRIAASPKKTEQVSCKMLVYPLYTHAIRLHLVFLSVWIVLQTVLPWYILAYCWILLCTVGYSYSYIGNGALLLDNAHSPI